MPQLFAEDPASAIQRSLYVNPFWEDNIREVTEYLSLDHILFGSDFPHPEGLKEPLSYLDELDGLTDDQQAMVMGGNLTKLMKVGA